MPETKSGALRFIARLRAVFEEDWQAEAGKRWRLTVGSIFRFNRRYLRLEDKAKNAPGLAWNAVEGLATERHAKAASDYSKAENDRIDAALKRRVLEDKARQERATANKLEAEAVQARIQELKARISLARDLEALGVGLVIESDGTMRSFDRPKANPEIMKMLLNPEETVTLNAALIDVRIPEFGDIKEGRLVRWLCRRGQRVEMDQPLLELETSFVDTEIPSPSGGILFELLSLPGEVVEINKTVVARIDPDGHDLPTLF